MGEKITADRFEEIKRVLIVYLKERIKRYKEHQQSVEDNEEGYFKPSIKTKITNFEKEICKLEENLPTELCYSERNIKKAQKMLFDVYFRRACKVEDENPDDRMIRTEELIERLGREGYELMKEYFSIKAGMLCLEKEIKEDKRKETITLFKRFNSLKIFWEKEILI